MYLTTAKRKKMICNRAEDCTAYRKEQEDVEQTKAIGELWNYKYIEELVQKKINGVVES